MSVGKNRFAGERLADRWQQNDLQIFCIQRKHQCFLGIPDQVELIFEKNFIVQFEVVTGDQKIVNFEHCNFFPFFGGLHNTSIVFTAYTERRNKILLEN
jgi:hypothetical protein